MHFYAVFGLLLRPSYIAMSVFIFVFLLVQTESTSNFLTLTISAILGIFPGRIVQELRHTLISRTLPNLRRRLFSSLLFAGVLTASIQTWIYRSAGGTAPLLPIFSSVLLWYSVGLVLGMNPVLVTMLKDIRRYGFCILIWILLFVALFTIDRIVDYCTVQPVWCGLLAFLGASLCMHRVFYTIVAGEESLGSNVYGKGVMDSSRRKWDHAGPIASLYSWIRAGEYENFGFRRVGWPVRATFVPSVAVLGASACIIVLTDDMPGKVMQQNSVAIQRVLNMFVSVAPAAFALIYSLEGCLYLQKGWVYPLSRKQLSSLAYRGALLYSAVFFGITLLAFLLRDLLMEQYTGYDFIRPLALMSILTPFFLLLRLRYGLLFSQIPTGYVSVFGSLVGIAVLSWYSLKAAPHISDLFEVVAYAGLILLSQILFRYRVETYFRRADLV